jgi:hypothetical protein
MDGKTFSGDAAESGMGEIDQSAFRALEEKVNALLVNYQKLHEERDALAIALDLEKEKASQLLKSLESFSNDKEKVKVRIDQLLHRLKGLDV